MTLCQDGAVIRPPPWAAFKRSVPERLRTSAEEFTPFCRTLLTELLVHLRAIEERIHFIEISIPSFVKQSALCGKLAQIPGIGPITATAIAAAVGDAGQFRNGRYRVARMSCCSTDLTGTKRMAGRRRFKANISFPRTRPHALNFFTVKRSGTVLRQPLVSSGWSGRTRPGLWRHESTSS
ncbi:transposase [Paraburkholderia sediminicola]|uniref:Transposase n=1 Tax=Paraburkholderia rhynchosiae TaxID=487049 RepID=A0ACC7NK80_9BURK